MSLKRPLGLWLLSLSLLLIPLIAMNITSEVQWSVGDFVGATILLSILVIGIEIALRMFRSRKARIIAAALVVLVFVVQWIELAVGLFNSPLAGN